MSAAELKGLIQSKTGPLLGNETKTTLKNILEMAKDEEILQVRSIPVTPVTSPLVVQNATAAIRVEMQAEALMGFLASMHAATVNAVAQAVVEYLNAHAQASYLPGSLVAGTYPVTPVPGVPVATKINY